MKKLRHRKCLNFVGLLFTRWRRDASSLCADISWNYSKCWVKLISAFVSSCIHPSPELFLLDVRTLAPNTPTILSLFLPVQTPLQTIPNKHQPYRQCCMEWMNLDEFICLSCLWAAAAAWLLMMMLMTRRSALAVSQTVSASRCCCVVWRNLPDSLDDY